MCTYVYIYMYKYVYIDMYKYVYIDMYKYVYTYTYWPYLVMFMILEVLQVIFHHTDSCRDLQVLRLWPSETDHQGVEACKKCAWVAESQTDLMEIDVDEVKIAGQCRHG